MVPKETACKESYALATVSVEEESYAAHQDRTGPDRTEPAQSGSFAFTLATGTEPHCTGFIERVSVNTV